MNKVIIIRWGEIHLKGKNRGLFEKMLENNLKHAIKDFDCTFKKISGRYLIKDFSEFYTEDILNKISKVSGVHSASVCEIVKNDIIATVGSLEAARALDEAGKALELTK